MRTFEWAIEDIIIGYPSLGLEDYAAMAVALMKRTAPPCEFLVQIDGFDVDDLHAEEQFLLRVTWNAETESRADRIGRTRQRAQIVEGGAIGLTVLLLGHLIHGSDLKVTIRGDAADFWLPRLHHALEISGTERVDEIARRHREKRRQVLGNSLGWDGYVVLCCFAESRRVIQWSYHSQGE
jgi:hypothetical protein